MRNLMRKLAFLPTISSVFILLFLGTGTTVFAGDTLLSWNPNTESDLAGYKVYYGTASGLYGTPINVGNQTAYTVTGLGLGTYYFTVTAYDTSGNESDFSSEVFKTIADTTGPDESLPPPVLDTSPPMDVNTDTAGPDENLPPPVLDTSPPMDISDFRAEPEDGQVQLTWINPPDFDYLGVRIRYRTDGHFPTNVQDGELVGDFTEEPSGTGSHLHAGLQNGVTYYYTAFTYDTSGNFSQTVYASATPIGSQATGLFDSDHEIEGGFGCGMIKNASSRGNPPRLPARQAAWPLDLFLLGTMLLWLSLRRPRSLGAINPFFSAIR